MKSEKMTAIILGAMLSLSVPIYAGTDAVTNEDVKAENDITGLGCVLRTEKDVLVLGDKITLFVGGKTSRIEQLYLYFHPVDQACGFGYENLPEYRRVRLSIGVTQWIAVEYSPKKSGTYTFCAQLSSSSPVAAIEPHRAISKPITIRVLEKPQQSAAPLPPVPQPEASVTVAQAGDKPLSEKLMDVALDHLSKNGPDSDVAQFVSMSGQAAWLRRDDFVRLVTPYLKDHDPAKVGGAIAVLYRLRCYRPRTYLGDFDKDNAEFQSGLDRLVVAQFEHFHSLTNNGLNHGLALYLGVSPSESSSRELRRIIANTSDGEQALICLAWHRNPKDMDFLFPYMLEDTPASRALPYHFRDSYGTLATPYLKRALMEAKATNRRMEAAFELIRLGEVEGFDCLLALVAENPKTLDKSPTVVEVIRQYARDYLAMPTSVSEPKDIASHLARKRAELVQRKMAMEKESNTASHGTALPCPP